MKTIIFLILFIFAFSSCEQDDIYELNNNPEKNLKSDKQISNPGVVALSEPDKIFYPQRDETPEFHTLSDNKTIDTNNSKIDLTGCDNMLSFHQNGGFPEINLKNAAFYAGGGMVCQIWVTEQIGFARLFDLTTLGIPADSKFIVTSVDYILTFNATLPQPVTVSIFSFPPGTVVPSMANGHLLATETTLNDYATYKTVYTQEIYAEIPAGEMVLVTVEAASNGFGGAIFGHDGGILSGQPELAPTYIFGCKGINIFPDYTDLDLYYPKGSIMLQLNGDIDTDCDGVGDLCDLCPGADDSGPCDAVTLPAISELPENYICSRNEANTKIKICHKGRTLCIDEDSIQDHLDHGDFLGPCSSCTDSDKPVNLVIAN